MHKLMQLDLLRALVAVAGIIGTDALGGELEGALQYPPPSVGEDAQPPSPARMLPQPGSSLLPSTQRFYIRSPLRRDGPGAPPLSGNGG
jgi:hypothetical protein